MISRFTKQLKGAVVVGALLVGSNAFAQLGLNWAEMGPNDIAGRCRSIIVDNTDATGNKLFAAGVSGGVFKSSDAGANWSPVNDQAQSLIVSSMAQDATGNVYFGTGETFGRGGDGAGSSGFVGNGLYKITANSSIITLLKDSATFGDVNEVAINSANAIYVASQKGLFYSTDGGATFNEEDSSLLANVPAMDVKIATNGDIYYSAGAKTSSTSAVWYKAFASTTFKRITPTTITNRGRIEIAPSPVDPNYVYLSIAKMKSVTTSSTGGLSAVLVSNTNGSAWSLISLGSTQFDPFMAGTKGVGDFANTIVAHPSKKDACYLGGDVFYVWDQIASNPLGQGAWEQIGVNFFTTQFPLAQVYIHSNVHAVTFNSGNGFMYIATDGGIFKLSGAPFFGIPSLTPFLPYNKGLNISQFNSVAFPINPKVTQTTNTLAPYAGVAGGSIGNSLTHLPGDLLNGPQASNSFGTSDAYQSDFSRLIPKAIFYSGASGSIFRSADVNLTPPSTFYDAVYTAAVTGGPGAPAFANENTPMRLWENYNGNDFAIFYNEIITSTFANTSPTKTMFSILNSRPQITSKYDTIFVKATGTKKIITTTNTLTVANSNSTSFTFTVANTRPSLVAKYDSIIIRTTSTKALSTAPPNQTITIKVAYTGSVATGYVVTGNASVTPATNNMVFTYSPTNDSIRFTFNALPQDSSIFWCRFKYKYYQGITILPVYTGTVISNCTVLGEANTAAATNNTVFVNASLSDSIRYTFASPIDSASVITTVKFRYETGDVITLNSVDISGEIFTASVTLTAPLAASVTPKPVVYLPLKKSARLATGVSNATNPGIFVVKRPLNFGINPDWIKIAGKNSRADSAGGTPYLGTASLTTSPVIGTTVTRLEWAPDGQCIYFSTKFNDTTYYLYRTSHLTFIGDVTAEDYSGIFSSDVDTTGGVLRKSTKQRTTALGKFKNPITGIAISADNMNVMITCGGYKKVMGTVYYSTVDTRTMVLNNTDATNFTVKDGTGLPLIPAYSGILEMTDNKRAIIGTENGIYSTMDITQASPTWVQEIGGSFPNVPVFQVRQQTFPAWLCYNSGVIYAATHGRGIWSTDKFFSPYAIGVEEQETVSGSNTNIKLFPNPANDATNLWFKANGDAKYSVTVYDINGRVLIQQTTGKLMEGEQKLSLNTSELTAGIYFVTVNGTNNFNANSKLVITH